MKPWQTGRIAERLQLLLGTDQFLHLGELVVELEALGVGQRAARLDGLPGDDLLDGELDLFEVDGCLCEGEQGG